MHPHSSSLQAEIPKDYAVKHRSLPCAGLSDRGVLRKAHSPPPQPPRRSSSQQCALTDRDDPHQKRRAIAHLHRTSTSGRESPPEIQRRLKHHIAVRSTCCPSIRRQLRAPTIFGRSDLAQACPCKSVADHFNVSLTTISRTERAIEPNYEFASRFRP